MQPCILSHNGRVAPWPTGTSLQTSRQQTASVLIDTGADTVPLQCRASLMLQFMGCQALRLWHFSQRHAAPQAATFMWQAGPVQPMATTADNFRAHTASPASSLSRSSLPAGYPRIQLQSTETLFITGTKPLSITQSKACCMCYCTHSIAP